MTFLPPMRPLGPLRISHEPLDAHPAYRRLLADAAATRCCPVWIGDLDSVQLPADPARAVADIGRHDPAEVLDRLWPGACYGRWSDPYGDAFPGLVPARPLVQDPADAAVALVDRLGFAHLALVAVTRPADVLAAVGWSGPCNYGLDLGELSAVLRSWEDRFGAVLVHLDRATASVAVAAPPMTEQDCLGVAAEHVAFCCDVDGEDPRPLRQYAAGLRAATSWTFWWD